MFFTDEEWLGFLAICPSAVRDEHDRVRYPEGLTEDQMRLLVPYVTEIHDRNQAQLRDLMRQLRAKKGKARRR